MANKMAIDCQKKSVKHLWDDWASLLNEDHEQEGLNKDWPVLTTPIEVRSMVWDISRKLGIVRTEVAAQAARILDRYLSHCLKISFEKYREEDYSIRWHRFQDSINGKMLVAILVCIRITFKVLINESAEFLSAKYLTTFLISLSGDTEINAETTQKAINDTEVKILFALGGRMPLWTSLQITMYISESIKLKQDYTLVLDCCELFRPDIERKVVTVGGLRPQDKGTLRTLPLCAGLVLMMARKNATQPERVLNEIVKITQLPVEMVKCVSDAISETIWDHFS